MSMLNAVSASPAAVASSAEYIKLASGLTLTGTGWGSYSASAYGTSPILGDVDESHLATDDLGIYTIYGGRKAKFDFANDTEGGTSTQTKLYLELGYGYLNSYTSGFTITVELFSTSGTLGSVPITVTEPITATFPLSTRIHELTDTGWDGLSQTQREDCYAEITFTTGSGKNQGPYIGTCSIGHTI